MLGLYSVPLILGNSQNREGGREREREREIERHYMWSLHKLDRMLMLLVVPLSGLHDSVVPQSGLLKVGPELLKG